MLGQGECGVGVDLRCGQGGDEGGGVPGGMGGAEQGGDSGGEGGGGAGADGLDVLLVAEVEAAIAVGGVGGRAIEGGQLAGAAGSADPAADGVVGAVGK